MAGCARSTKHIPAVAPFEIDHYIGTWYEIARLPHSFEKGLTHVTAEYRMGSGETILVVNKGYDAEKGRWKTSRAKARLASEDNRGELKVTFFWPFSARYRVIALDQEDYQYAVVTSSIMSYFWVLSRSPEMDAQLLEDLLTNARGYGFDLTELIMVDQSSEVPGKAPTED